MFSNAESISFRGKEVKKIVRINGNAILYQKEDDDVRLILEIREYLGHNEIPGFKLTFKTEDNEGNFVPFRTNNLKLYKNNEVLFSLPGGDYYEPQSLEIEEENFFNIDDRVYISAADQNLTSNTVTIRGTYIKKYIEFTFTKKQLYLHDLTGSNMIIDYGNGDIRETTGELIEYNYNTLEDETHIVKIYGVTGLGYESFKECYGLTDMTIPFTVTSIGRYCFTDCDHLENINIPSTITSLPRGCFSYCTRLSSIDIPSSIISIEGNCFYSCSSLAEINLNWTALEDIVSYQSNWITSANANLKFIIPEGTTDLYIEKGYPSNKLVEISEDETIDVSVSVSYRNDNNNQDGNRPTEIPIELIVSGTIVIRTATLTPENNWSYTFSDLEDGISYQLSASEIDFYDLDITKNNNDFTITADYLPPLTNATVQVTFDDVIPDYRPQSITATLNNGTEVTLTNNNGWSTNISNLPAVVNHETATYDWTIAQVPHYEIFQKTKNGNVTRFILKQLDNIPASITLEKTGGEQILSYVDRQTLPVMTEFCELTATVKDENNNPLSNADIDFYKNDELWINHISTDSNGQATIPYYSEGVGDVEIYAKCGSLVTENLIIEDCLRYDPATSDKTSSYGSIINYRGGSGTWNYNSTNGYYGTLSDRNEVMVDLPELTGKNNFIIEFDALFNSSSDFKGISGICAYEDDNNYSRISCHGQKLAQRVSVNGSATEFESEVSTTVNRGDLLHFKFTVSNNRIIEEVTKGTTSVGTMIISYTPTNATKFGLALVWVTLWTSGTFLKNIKIKPLQLINIDVDNPILSYIDGDTATLTATVNPVMSGKTVQIYQDDVLVATEQTDSQGQVSYEYESQGVGDVEFYAKYGSLVTENIMIEDIWYYDHCATNKGYWNIQSQATFTFSEQTGLVAIGNTKSDVQSFLNINYPSNYEIECELTDIRYGSGICGGLYLNDVGIIGFNSPYKIRTELLGGDIQEFTNESLSVGDIIKLRYENGNVSIYRNNTYLSSFATNTNHNFGIRTYLNWEIGIKNLKIRELQSIDISVDNPILSYADNTQENPQTATLTATVNPIESGRTVQIFKDDVLVATEQTDSQGQVSYEYTSQGGGDVGFEFKYGSITETYTIQDCFFYDSQTVDKSRYSTSSGNITYNSNGCSVVGTEDCAIVENTALTLPNSNYSIECEIGDYTTTTSGSTTYKGGIIIDNSFIDVEGSRVVVYQLNPISFKVAISNKTVNIGDIVKIERESGSLKYYLNNVPLTTQTISSTGKFGYRSCINRGLRIKDLKVKPL